MSYFTRTAFSRGVHDVFTFAHLRRWLAKIARRMVFREPDCSLSSQVHQDLLADFKAKRGHAPKGMAK